MNWLNLLVFLILIAGHCELWVMLINRVHARPLSCRTLRNTRHLHDVAIPLFPVLLVWRVGLTGPRLLLDGNWSELPVGWSVYLSLCALGTVALTFAALRWQLQRPPRRQTETDSRIIDIAEQLGERPVGDGPHRFLLRVPGNEVFQVELTEKTFRLPRLPRDWDGLSILHLSDLHFIGTPDVRYYRELMKLAAERPVDLVVFTGDLLDRPELVEWLPETLGRLTAPLGRYFILGNHDWFLEPHEIRRALGELGWRDVAGRVLRVAHRGHVLSVGGTERPWMGAHPDFSTSEANAFRLLLSHTPDNLSWARSQGVDLMLSGHNHGGQVVLPGLGPVYSPSRYGVQYAAGTFWRPPTLLHVSRGVAGRHPLRWNCRPEIGRLVLRAE